jgi:hypothetical protein
MNADIADNESRRTFQVRNARRVAGNVFNIVGYARESQATRLRRKLTILQNITLQRVAVVRALYSAPRVPHLEGAPTFVVGAHGVVGGPTL